MPDTPFLEAARQRAAARHQRLGEEPTALSGSWLKGCEAGMALVLDALRSPEVRRVMEQEVERVLDRYAPTGSDVVTALLGEAE